MKLIFWVFLMGCSVQVLAQPQVIERAVISGQTDSLLHYTANLEDSDAYQKQLRKVILGKSQPHYEDWIEFFDHVYENNELHPLDVLKFFQNNIKEPKRRDFLNLDYVKLEWKFIRYMSESIMLDEGQLEQEKLKTYLNQFNQDDPNYYEAKFYLNVLPINISLIQSKLEPGKSLCIENQEIATALKDTNLMVYANYLLSDFLILEQDLMGYIQLMEGSLDLEKNRTHKSPHYFATIGNLIDAYIYADHDKKEIIELIDLYSQDKYGYYDSYSYYIQLLGTLSGNDTLSHYILNKFEVDDEEQLVKSVDASAKQNLKSNDYHQFLRISSETLLRKGFFQSAVIYKDLDVEQIEYIYSQDLSESIANYEVQIVKNQLLVEKENGKILTLLLGASILFITMILFFIYLQYKKNKKLVKKNEQIEAQKLNIQEKNQKIELLMKEIHHRVKNNFQVISSLLELQANELQDDSNAKNVTLDGQARVKSMALIHQKLYQNDDFQIHFKDFLINLFRNINSLYRDFDVELEFDIEEDINLDIDTAVPLGLLLNELITNAFKYAFSKEKENVMAFKLLKHPNHFELIIQDFGKGLPHDVDLSKSKSIGIKLIYQLAKQLHGRYTYQSEDGLTSFLVFKDTKQRSLID